MSPLLDRIMHLPFRELPHNRLFFHYNPIFVFFALTGIYGGSRGQLLMEGYPIASQEPAARSIGRGCRWTWSNRPGQAAPSRSRLSWIIPGAGHQAVNLRFSFSGCGLSPNSGTVNRRIWRLKNALPLQGHQITIFGYRALKNAFFQGF